MHVRAVIAAPDPEFMLDRDDVDAAIDGSGDLQVVGRLIASDAVMDLDRIGRRLPGGMEGNDLAAARG